MKAPVATGYKWCANCAYWGGERTMNGAFHRMECDASARGQCAKHIGWSQSPMNATCNEFQWHPIIKK